MTEEEIYIDFDRAIKEADKLDQMAGRLTAINSKYEDNLNNISTNWKGENAVIFVNKGGTLYDSMGNTANQISEIAENIRAAAERIKNAELEAIRIANEREYC